MSDVDAGIDDAHRDALSGIFVEQALRGGDLPQVPREVQRGGLAAKGRHAHAGVVGDRIGLNLVVDADLAHSRRLCQVEGDFLRHRGRDRIDDVERLDVVGLVILLGALKLGEDGPLRGLGRVDQVLHVIDLFLRGGGGDTLLLVLVIHDDDDGMPRRIR